MFFPFYVRLCYNFLGGHDDIILNSDPTGAKVTVNGSERGKTPITLSLKKGKEYTFEFTKDGYEKKIWHLTYSLGAGWLILDILCGLVGVLVDGLTGNWNGFDETSYKAVLEPVK